MTTYPRSDRGFDTNRALQAAAHYRLSTGVECIVIDSTGGTVPGGSDGSQACAFCRAFHAATGESVQCRQAHLYGSFQSMRFGGTYTYFCPLGLTHVCSPIMADGRMVGSLVGGPVRLIELDELVDELRTRHQLDAPQTKRISRSAASVPEVSPTRARSLGEILMFTASWVSGVNVQELVEEEERLSREARVSDYIHSLKTMGGESTSIYPAMAERELLQTIRDGDREKAQAVLEELLATIRVASGEDRSAVKARVLELVVLLSRAAVDGGADAESVFGINYRALEEVHRLESVAELTAWISGIAARYVQFVFDVRSAGKSDVYRRAVTAMRRRLGEKIGLEEIAAEVSLSPAYFSRIFKEEAGTSFTSCLNDMRVERAKDLLRGTRRSILEIAMDVGFSDQSHFSRVFRDRVQMSPKRYRSASGRYPSESHEIHE